jgi:type IV pilus assembly protein PilW
MNNHPASVLKQRGLSLIEIMVALTLSLVLTAGVITIFVNNKQSYRIQEASARLQENARFAINLLEQDIHQARFLGCNGRAKADIEAEFINVLDPNGSDIYLNFKNPVQGLEALNGTAWSPAALPSGLTTAVGGSDIFVLRRAIGMIRELTAGQGASAAPLPIAPTPNNPIPQFSNMLVSSCERSAIFQVTNADAATTGSVAHAATTGPNGQGNWTGAFTNRGSPGNGIDFKSGDILTRVNATALFIGRNPASGELGLWQSDGSPNPELLIEGVASMQVRYGVGGDDGSQAVTRYVTADNVTDWGGVRTVEVSLLMQSSSPNAADRNVLDTPQTWVFPSQNDEPNQAKRMTFGPDRRLRRVFTTVVALRNRMP